MKQHARAMISSVSHSPAFARPAPHDNAHRAGAGQEAGKSAGDQAATNARSAPAGASSVSRVQLAAKPSSARNQTPFVQQAKPPAAERSSGPDSQPTEEEKRSEQKLRQIDAKVRAHEQAHSAAGGAHAGTASYKFVSGPNGKRYAVSGEVPIDASPVRDNPMATVRKMEQVISAALAPADPSSQDLAVARSAQATRAKAQAAITKQNEAERDQASKENPDPGDPKGVQSAQSQRSSADIEAEIAYTAGFNADNGAVAVEIFSALFA